MKLSINAVACGLLIFVIFISLNWLAIAFSDVTPPVIMHEPVTTGTEHERIIIEAVIQDNVAVINATLHFRKIGDSNYSPVLMLLCEGCFNVYEASIPGSEVTPRGVEYYISATDGINVATHPETNPESKPHRISIANQPPSEVELNEPSEIGEHSLKLEWSTSRDEDFARYEIYQSTSSETNGTLIQSITDKKNASFTVTGLLPDTTYFFRIKVVDTGNLSTYSNQVHAKTTAPSTFPWTWLTATVLLVMVITASSLIIRKKTKRTSKKHTSVQDRRRYIVSRNR